MITDTLRNAHLYRGLSPRIALACDRLCGRDFAAPAPVRKVVVKIAAAPRSGGGEEGR